MSAQGVENYDDVDGFLQKCAGQRRKLASGENGHQSQAQSDTREDALRCDPECAPRDAVGNGHVGDAVLHYYQVG